MRSIQPPHQPVLASLPLYTTTAVVPYSAPAATADSLSFVPTPAPSSASTPSTAAALVPYSPPEATADSQSPVLATQASVLSAVSTDLSPSTATDVVPYSAPDATTDSLSLVPATQVSAPAPYTAVADRNIAEKTVLVTNEEQHIVWEGYGLRLHIPSNSLPENCSQFELKIAVGLSGDFELPDDGVLVSAIYSFSHELGEKELRQPVTLEMQHCATPSGAKELSIVRSDEESDSPYEFQVITDGMVTISDDGYGVIKLHRLCSFGVYMRWFLASMIWKLDICAKLYYTNLQPRSFEFHIYIVPNLDAVWREIEAYSSYISGPVLPLTFAKSKISLNLSGKLDDGWKMKAINSHKKGVKSIANMLYGARLIPFQVSVSLAGDQPTDLEYDVKIDGVEEPSNCITVKLPAKYTDASPSSHSKSILREKPDMRHIGLIIYRDDDGEKKEYRPINHISTAWEAIATQLKVDSTDIQNAKGLQDATSAADKVIRIWLGLDAKASWSKLIGAMKVKEELKVAAEHLKTALINMVQSDN